MLAVDAKRRQPGRGAWLHHDPVCFAAAVRRRAFGRALRIGAAVDPSAVGAYVAQAHENDGSQNDGSQNDEQREPSASRTDPLPKGGNEPMSAR